MERKVTAIKICDVQESRSLHNFETKRYLNITMLLHMEIDGKPVHKTVELLPGNMYEIQSLIA